MRIDLTTIIVDDYDAAIDFYVDVLGFELVEDSPSLTNDGRPKRWVVVRPPAGGAGLLLAEADGDEQRRAVGAQWVGRVGLFLDVDSHAAFDATYARLEAAGVELESPPRDEPYGRVAVFADAAGNRWDLLGPAGARPAAGPVGEPIDRPREYRYTTDERLPVEVLVFQVDPAEVDDFLRVDHEIWTLGEAFLPGHDHIPVRAKEVWLDDAHPGRVTLVFVWDSLDAWERVGETSIQQQLQAAFADRFTGRVDLIRAFHEESSHGIHRWSRFERRA